MMKREYTTKEWAEREEYYINTLNGLVIPEQPTTKEVLKLTSALDKLYTEASFECAMVKRKESRLSLELKNAEAEMFNILKQQQLTAGAKITENDVKGLVKTYLANTPIQGYSHDIYTMIKAVMDRLVFIEAVVKAVSEKKASIISATAMLKIDSSFSSAKDKVYE